MSVIEYYFFGIDYIVLFLLIVEIVSYRFKYVEGGCICLCIICVVLFRGEWYLNFYFGGFCSLFYIDIVGKYDDIGNRCFDVWCNRF